MKITIHLGDEVRDTITGFRGVVICDATWLNGCRRLTIQPKQLKDGKPIGSETMDVEQLELVRVGKAAPLKQTGGPHPEPRRY